MNATRQQLANWSLCVGMQHDNSWQTGVCVCECDTTPVGKLEFVCVNAIQQQLANCWREQRQVLFVVKNLPTVVVSFTEANSSLPTQVCQ